MNLHEFQQSWLSSPRRVIGMMSGTSLDGIDICFAEFSINTSGQHCFNLLEKAIYPMPLDVKDELTHLMQDTISIEEVSHAQARITKIHADIVMRFLEEKGINPSQCDALSVHGQTVWHSPPKDKGHVGHTLQILSIPALSALTGIRSIGDFRTADMAMGGQGAPLVPIFDAEFLHSEIDHTIAINIGGMANLTIIPKERGNSVLAFDTGPGNILIDLAMRRFFGKQFDENGLFASEGKVLDRLWKNLCELEFITQKPPKSTGREVFNEGLLRDLLEVSFVNTFPGEDIVRTITDFTAWSIAENIRLFGWDNARVLVTGGGANNSTLMNRLRKELPDSVFFSAQDVGFDEDIKEALCFAYLGWRSLGGLPGNIPSVTGASASVVLGSKSC
jgi:anhydro-N-acetylmuramic acid kinase